MVTKTKKYTKKPASPRHCIVCGSEYKKSNLFPRCHCQICKSPLKGHPKCSMCEILIGNNHVEQTFELTKDDKVICDTCAQWFRREKRIRDDD